MKRLPFEEKAAAWFKKNEEVIFVVLVSLAGIVFRFFLITHENHDMGAYLKWYGRAEECGGLPGLYELGQRVKGYNAMFQLVFALLTHFPGAPLYKIKITWMLFDILLATGSGRLVYELKKHTAANAQDARRSGIFAYALVFLSMNVIFNSAAWGQSDSVYVSLIIWSLVFLFRENYLRSFVLLGLALAFKLQAVFIFPFYLFYYFYKKKFSVLYFLAVPVMFAASSLPRNIIYLFSPVKAQAAGDSFLPAQKLVSSDLPGILEVYLKQLNSGIRMYFVFPSFWAILPDKDGAPGEFMDFYKFRIVAIIMCFILLALLIYFCIRLLPQAGSGKLLHIALVLSFTTVFFLPCMMDRYGYIYEVLALALVFFDRRTIAPAVALHLIMHYIYGGRTGSEMYSVSMQFFSVGMLLVYSLYILLLFYGGKERADA